ncbi:hypothetical protein OIU74_005468 [Salix koriyanagi]|uniref:Uncharacterized protein n=1 Tax=Salix koriyanagi TaxID=2511006 RepID=A0A9Q0UNZ5_9ROSI|nr:hypothetical protein OIU74_005468 [Salix koriyanagi]
MSDLGVHYEYHVELKPFHQELAKFPLLFLLVSDPLFDHIQDFKDILTEMDIPAVEQSKILDKISSKAHGVDTYCGSFMSVRIVKVILRPDQSAVNNEEKDVAKAEGKSMEN